MAVIKTFEMGFGHLWNGDYAPEMSVEEAIRAIKRTRETEGRYMQAQYIGERDMVDVDASKVRCMNCREFLINLQAARLRNEERQKRRGVERH